MNIEKTKEQTNVQTKKLQEKLPELPELTAASSDPQIDLKKTKTQQEKIDIKSNCIV